MKYVLALLIISINFIVFAQAAVQGVAWNNNCRVDLRLMEHLQQKCFWSAGTVRKIDQDIGVVTIFHNAVPELGWPAMTMPFAVKDLNLFNRFKVGERLEFEFEVGVRNSVIVSIR